MRDRGGCKGREARALVVAPATQILAAIKSLQRDVDQGNRRLIRIEGAVNALVPADNTEAIGRVSRKVKAQQKQTQDAIERNTTK